MIEGLFLGFLQGIVEWLPISSEGVLTMANVYLTQGDADLSESIHLALFLHLGTFFSALVYFRERVWKLIEPLSRFRWHDSPELRNVFRFLVISTIVSGLLGFFLLKGIEGLESELKFTGTVILLLIGFLLLVTGFLQWISESEGLRGFLNITWKDALLLGLAQALAVFPGLSRSGLTVSALLLVQVREEESLELSFLMSLPIVFLGNIFLNLEYFRLTMTTATGLATSFVVGLITIHYLLKLARAIDFSYFVFLFAVLTFLAAAFV